MATLLGETLSPEYRMLLGQLSSTPGYQVLKMLMEEMCQKANAKAIKVDPTDADYDKLLPRLQLQARAINDFSSSLIMSIEYQVAKAIIESDEALDPAEKILREKDLNDPSVLQSNS